MKTMNTLKALTVVLLLTVWQPLRAQEARTNSSQNQNKREQMNAPDQNSKRDIYWMPSSVENGIFYKGLVGINTPSPAYELHVDGSARVSSLNINGQYSFPTTKATSGHYLNGIGEWTPMPISGGTGYWQGVMAGKDAIVYDGFVGIKTGVNMPRYTLDVNGSVGVQTLEIIGQYALPGKAGTENEFLRGDGIWAVPSAGGGGGDCHWQSGEIGNGSIYFSRGNVGIGTTGPNANASLQVVGNINIGNNPHTGSQLGEYAFVGGLNSIASGNYSFAFGRESKATHMHAIALGFKVEATSEMAVAIGYINKARAESTYLFGERLSAGSSGAFVIGRGASSENSLQNNVNSSLMIGFNSTVPTFFVSQSSGVGTTGNIGIGNMTDPQAKLHIYSDMDKAATLKLEHRTTGKDRYAEIGLGTHRIRAGNFENMVFSTPATNRHFVFENGNVGIGTSSPKEKLSVDSPSGRPINFHIGGTQNIYSNAWYDGIDKRAKQGPAYAINFSGSRMAFRVAEDGAANSQIAWSEVISVNTIGNVGIGTIDPQANLEVKGDVLVTGGNVGIGTSASPRGKLDVVGDTYVEGVIFSNEVIVEEATNWPDYVFEPDYQLMDLNELKSFITINKHLPDIRANAS